MVSWPAEVVVNTAWWSANGQLLVTVADRKQAVIGGRLERFRSLSIVYSICIINIITSKFHIIQALNFSLTLKAEALSVTTVAYFVEMTNLATTKLNRYIKPT